MRRSGPIIIRAFARSTLTSDLDTRDTFIHTRISTDIATTIATVEKIVQSTDVLYDKRYVWISARISLESGLVVQQTTAVVNRIKNQADIYNQLVKLLAVQGA